MKNFSNTCLWSA